ncbi:MAG: membrane-bound lytic murein transglycosylase D [Cyclobacteriaceae bacterium]|jgi:membrane-bound lytic murein transglycosylase D
MLLIFAGSFLAAQPRVPKVMDFAGMKLELTEEARSLIQKDVNALHASQSHLEKRLDVIRLYFPIIERIFKEENVPDEIKYLVIQESGLIADAVSTSDAVGFWQFKDFTAREVGLRVDNKIDERKNIAAASRGAAKYLKRNNFQFDNWGYAISAYQAGLGGVRKYVDSKYYGTKKMPITKNTHWYFRKYLAHKIAFEGIVEGRQSEGLVLTEYTKGGGKTLEKIAKDAKVELDLLRYYNKWIETGEIPTDKTYSVIIPTKGKLPRSLDQEVAPEPEKEAIAEIEAPIVIDFPDEIKPGITSHRNSVPLRINGVLAMLAGTNDNLASLAAEAGISPDKVQLYNDLNSSQSIEAGRAYYISPKKSKSDIGFHVTKRDQTLWAVSQQYGMKLDKLAKRNRLTVIDEITIGQVLWLSGRRPKNTPFEYHDVSSNTLTIVSGNLKIHASEIPSDEKLDAIRQVTEIEPEPMTEQPQEEMSTVEPASSSEAESAPMSLSNYVKKGKQHMIEAGETLWSISKRYEISVDEINEWNNLTSYDVLRIGQNLYVSAPTLKKKAIRNEAVYIVRGGDTYYQIAKKYGMSVTELMDLNNKESTELSVGEELRVYRN